MEEPAIYKIRSIDKGFLAGMAMPTPGDSLEQQLTDLADKSVQQIVSLLEKNEEQLLGLGCEQNLARKHGMGFVSYPIEDMSLPQSLSSYREFTLSLHQKISQGVNTLVHCRAGIGRTGIITAGILIHTGLAPEAAFDLISEQRGVAVPDTQQQRDWVISNYREIVKGV